ncbi:MAG: bifunctional UDP-N-acetylglucosamine diphosphorylase/glucosamine-1-phosphate N-acetyltransferase GlmU [Sporomusaceae bacterium]|nr:bifunctional UDP-N-acetylglucosamine diphosphorylase/glucosamine-1-phosphate N-acetyltransferase GlmU [Sporomusaceae bacterium]
MTNIPCTAVILAAGKGTRMKSSLPKVLHKIGGKSLVQHVIDAAKGAGVSQQIVVVGFGGAQVRQALAGQAMFAEQKEQLGTGHAVLQALPQIPTGEGTVMVLCGDTPLLTVEMLQNLLAEHEAAGAKATVLTAHMPDATGYGRVIRDEAGQVVKIVEQKDASPEELAVREINTGIYCFEQNALAKALAATNCNNAQGEYYLTDVVAILAKAGEKVWAVAAADYEATSGINSRRQLAAAELVLRKRKLDELMDQGVTIMDMNSTFIDETVTIGPDTIIYPFTWIEGDTVIGSGCEIGPNSRLQNCRIRDDVTIHFSYAHDCTVESQAIVGPYAHLRPDTHLAFGVKVGNFVEVKNSTIGKGSKLPHLSYIGDTDMGEHVNIGCGTITVNYDGYEKHRTTIGDHAFIGCNSNLVAPVTIEDDTFIAAGSTITKDVPKGALGVARSRQTILPGWTEKMQNKRK